MGFVLLFVMNLLEQFFNSFIELCIQFVLQICSACAELDWLIVDGFIQDIINATPNDAMKVEFTSSSNWRLKKDTEPSVLSSKVQSHTGTVECIDLTYSPLPKKSVVIDLTHSP